MKRVLFFLVSAVIAGVGYCSSVGHQVSNFLTNNDNSVEVKEQKSQPLILQKLTDTMKTMYSHSSHSSHYSHYSHRSHYSHYSSR